MIAVGEDRMSDVVQWVLVLGSFRFCTETYNIVRFCVLMSSGRGHAPGWVGQGWELGGRQALSNVDELTGTNGGLFFVNHFMDHFLYGELRGTLGARNAKNMLPTFTYQH